VHKKRVVYVDEDGNPLPDDQQEPEEEQLEVVNKQRTVYVDEYGVPLPDSEQDDYEEPQGTGMPEGEELVAGTIKEAEAQTTD
jgi:hypothetical protein